MKISTQTGVLSGQFAFEKVIDIIAQAGYDAIDFSVFNEEYYTDAHDKSFYIEAKKRAEDKGLYFNQAHAPFASSFENEVQTKKRFEEITVAMKHASYLGVKNIIVHPCQHLNYNSEGNVEKLFEINMDFYRRLIPYAQEYGVKVALENMWQYDMGNIVHSTCSRPDEFIRYFDELNNDAFTCCLDIGHTLLVRELPDLFIRKLGAKRLTCLHVHDVDGINDLHTLPYFGKIDWSRVMCALADIGYTGELTFEADAYLKNIPVDLWADAQGFMAKTGRHLAGVFESH